MRPVGSKYLLEETLGRGATGTVWRGRVRADVAVPGSEPGQPVAIKVLREELAADPDVVMRFLRERSLLLRLTHPNIVKVRDLVVEGELLALVMDLIEGPDLARYLRGNGPFSPIAGALLMAQVADALAASHADGVVHRDLKPANVLLASTVVDGTEQMHPMLTDFGIARLADSPGITRTHEFVGTPAYVAPESAEGRPQTSAVDVYGAGIMLYELVTGRQPFQGDGPLQILQAHLAQEPQRPSTMPDPLWTVIERCLRKDPAQRPSAVTLAHALRVVAAGVGVHASPAAVDAALAVGALLPPDPQPAAVPGNPAAAGPPGTEDRTQVLPAGPQGGQYDAQQYDPAAATRVMGTQPPPAAPYGAADRTQVMPPTPPGPPQPEAPHPWQTQLRAARDRNQQTEIGYFEPEDFEAPPVAPPPYQAGQGGQGGPARPQGPQGYPQQPPRGYQQAPPPGYAQRPPVAPPPYQAGQRGQAGPAGQAPPGGRPQPPGGYNQPPQHGRPPQGHQPPQAYGQQQRPQAGPPGGYPAPPAQPAVPRRAEPPAPQRREPPQRREAPPQPAPREAAPAREPRRRSRNRMYIPGLGCLKGCLMVLLVLAVAAVALWNFTPLPQYWADVRDWFTSASDWVGNFVGSSKG
ncbi:protein kinase [Kitasatospora sp. NPDC050463]|uniref:serine/threonine-protein kinase n=1 Tax=Kitasatospora sp. NPDC050463 TaxID=3155786 RepID=UPI0033F11AC1